MGPPPPPPPPLPPPSPASPPPPGKLPEPCSPSPVGTEPPQGRQHPSRRQPTHHLNLGGRVACSAFLRLTAFTVSGFRVWRFGSHTRARQARIRSDCSTTATTATILVLGLLHHSSLWALSPLVTRGLCSVLFNHSTPNLPGQRCLGLWGFWGRRILLPYWALIINASQSNTCNMSSSESH